LIITEAGTGVHQGEDFVLTAGNVDFRAPLGSGGRDAASEKHYGVVGIWIDWWRGDGAVRSVRAAASVVVITDPEGARGCWGERCADAVVGS
jgi:hypothetical protein